MGLLAEKEIGRKGLETADRKVVLPVKNDLVTTNCLEKRIEKDTPKWQVIAENGVMYYTNKKPKVGDIAFYLNDNNEITDRNGNEFTKQ